jgi:trans-aconitate methyltransferase
MKAANTLVPGATDAPVPTAEFDSYATDYDEALNGALAFTGEVASHYAFRRIQWLKSCLKDLGRAPQSVLDFGCGMGSTGPLLIDALGTDGYIGVDSSAACLDSARRQFPLRFLAVSNYTPRQDVDLVYCNGVFHHIPPEQRAGAVDYLYRALRPAGLLALWENNPLNPGTRYAMHRTPFDKNAITLRAAQARRLVEKAGFRVLRTDYLFLFPRSLAWLRWIEPRVARLPIGAQYQILCEK